MSEVASLTAGQRHYHKNVRLVAHHPRDMTLAGQILRQHDVPGSESSNGTVATLDVPLPGERHDILPARGRVPVNDVAGRGAAKDHAGGRLERGRLHSFPLSERQLFLLEVRLLVLARVDSDDFHPYPPILL